MKKIFYVQTNFIVVQNGYLRINFKTKSDDKSEVDGNGSFVDEKHIKTLYALLNEDDILVLSGSLFH